ncbi:hypothetical protein Gohar_002947 [Gossypium harknessii]|uniref:RNase H type-1 domain-containing protein n=1 Tax=Gossypium harknessii TaxID=34285 RepID=A0A7J9HN12_9ROSI|nr:hypothetical protein [Gossypium harknessii]
MLRESCSICRNRFEDVLDLFRDYRIAKDVWLQVIPQEKRPIFLSSNLTKWVTLNLEDHSRQSTCIYLNVGGVFQMKTGLSVASGVIRDEMGKWILDYNWFLGKSSVFVAELWVILERLVLLQKQGHDRVLILSDNLEAIKVICNLNLDMSSISLVRRIQDILLEEKMWFLRHIRREDNQGLSVRIPLKHGGESVEENASIDLCLISFFISAAMYSVKGILQS